MRDMIDIFESFFQPFRYASQAYCPSIKQVIDNNPTTIVKFVDGTKSVVKCSQADTYNLETAILYAIVKRTFATRINPISREVVCVGLGNSLKRIVNNLTIHPNEKNLQKSDTKTISVKSNLPSTGKCISMNSSENKTHSTQKSKISQTSETFSVKNEIKPEKCYSCTCNKSKFTRKRDSCGRFI